MKDVAASAVSAHTAVLPNLDTLIRGLLYVYIFSLPFSPLLFVERNGFIILVVLLLLWCAVNRRHFFTRTSVDVPLLAFLAWVAFTIPFAAFPGYSLKEFGKLLQQGLLFYVVVYFFEEESRKVRLLRVLVAALLIIAVYGVIEFQGLIGVWTPEERPTYVTSFMGAEVWLSTYLVMLIPVAFSLAVFERGGHARVVYAAAAGLASLCLVFTFSRAGILALACEVWMLAWFLRRRSVWLVTAVFTLALVILTVLLLRQGTMTTIPGTTIPGTKANEASLIHRADIWKFTIGRLLEHPIVGVGYGKDNFKLVYGDLEEKSEPGRLPVHTGGTHNTFLDLALGVGIPGVALFIWLMQRIGRRTLEEFRRVTDDPMNRSILLGVGVSLVGLMIRLFFDHMFVGTLAILFWVLVALAVPKGRADRRLTCGIT